MEKNARMTKASPHRRNSPYLIAGLVSLVTFSVYLTALRNGFVLWDDDVVVYNNIHIRSLGHAFLRWALFDTHQLWQPVTWMSFGLDYLLWGLNPFGYHLTNISLHAANTFLAVRMVIGLCGAAIHPVAPPSERTGIGPGPSTFLSDRAVLMTGAVTGLLFGLHPLHVESVAWVSGRNQLFCAFFFFLSIMNYNNYVTVIRSRVDQKASTVFFFHRNYLLSLVFFVLAVSSQPLPIVLPVLLLVLDWWPFGRFRSNARAFALLVEKVPFLLLSLATSLLAVHVEKTSGSLSQAGQLPFATRLLVAGKALVAYLSKMLVPLHLVPFYPYPEKVSLLSFEYFSSVTIVLAISAWSIVTVKSRPLILTVWLYFLITLFPVIGVVQIRDVYMADRYTYLSGLGPFLLIALAVAWGWAKADRFKPVGTIIRGVGTAVAFALCIAMVFTTLDQIGIWKDTVTLWSRVIEEEPARVPGAYLNRGWAFKELKQYDRAFSDFNTAIALERRPPYLAYNNRGVTYKEIGQYDLAIEDFTRAIGMDPAPYLAYNNRGLVYGITGLRDEAIGDFTKAIALNPSYADAYTGRGLMRVEAGQLRLGVEDLNKAVLLNPFSVDAYLNRGVAFERLQQFDRAIADYGKAIELDPSDYLAYSNRGIVFEKTGDLESAAKDYKRACELGSNAACGAMSGHAGRERTP